MQIPYTRIRSGDCPDTLEARLNHRQRVRPGGDAWLPALGWGGPQSHLVFDTAHS